MRVDNFVDFYNFVPETGPRKQRNLAPPPKMTGYTIGHALCMTLIMPTVNNILSYISQVKPSQALQTQRSLSTHLLLLESNFPFPNNLAQPHARELHDTQPAPAHSTHAQPNADELHDTQPAPAHSSQSNHTLPLRIHHLQQPLASSIPTRYIAELYLISDRGV